MDNILNYYSTDIKFMSAMVGRVEMKISFFGILIRPYGNIIILLTLVSVNFVSRVLSPLTATPPR